jgi:RNA polymerase sigma-70 factor (ECF subfamily)
VTLPSRPEGQPLRRLADAEIDALWLGGEPEALGEVNRRYRGRLEAVAYRILGDRADAEDVVQRIFLALPRIDFHGRASLWTYLYRAAWNGALNVLRAKRRREVADGEALGRALGLDLDEAAGPEARVLEGQILGAVSRALLSVKPQHRRALTLRIVWDLSNTEIAEREAVPLATVGTWLRRGREELRQALGALLRDLDRGGE